MSMTDQEREIVRYLNNNPGGMSRPYEIYLNILDTGRKLVPGEREHLQQWLRVLPGVRYSIHERDQFISVVTQLLLRDI